MAITLQAINYSNRTSVAGTTFTVTYPGGIGTDDLLVAITVRFTDGGNVGTWPSGWNQIGTPNIGGHKAEVRAKKAVGTESGTFNITGYEVCAATCQIYHIRGHNSDGSSAVGVGTMAFVDDPNPPSFSPSWGTANDLLIAVAAAGGSDAFGGNYPSGYTAGQWSASYGTPPGGGSPGDAWQATGYRIANVTTEDAGAFTGSGFAMSYLVAVQEGSFGTPPAKYSRIAGIIG